MTKALLIFGILMTSGLAFAQGGLSRQIRSSASAHNEKASQGNSANQTNDNINAFPDNCEVPNQAPFPTDLKYYQNFHPSDSIFDFWCKAQGLTGSGKYVIEVGTGDHYRFVHSERFSFDGTPRLSKRYLAKIVTEAIQMDVQMSRDRAAITPMTVFGFPADTKEGQRAMYGNNQLLLRFEGLEIMGTPFSVTGFFSNSDGSLVKWLTGVETPLEFLVKQRVGTLSHETVIAVPLVFRSMMLYSDDAKLQYSRDELVSTLEKKYGKYKTKPGVYTDKSNGITVEEGKDNRGRNYIKISYGPNINGPLDPMMSNDLPKLAKEAIEGHKAAEKTNIDANKGKNPL
jgi:hypothetical protein